MHEQNVFISYSGLLFSNKKELLFYVPAWMISVVFVFGGNGD
jgi:hypothetical protein